MDVKKKLQDIFREVFDDETMTIREDMTARDVVDWDSLAQIQLLASAEKVFHIRFSASEVINLKNVGTFIELIKKKLS